MTLLIAILGSIFAIFSVIILHELGHYFVAKAFGIKILRFSIGFGKALWKHVSKNGTEYVVALLPLGGYVKMLGEGDEIISPEEARQAYNKKPVLVRMAVVLAGPLVNFLIAVVALWAVYLIGVTHNKPIVGAVVPNSIAAVAGVHAGDEVIKVGGRSVHNWQQVMMAMVQHMGRSNMVLTVKTPDHDAVADRILVLTTWIVNERNPDFFGSLGLSPYQPKIPPIIAKVLPHSPAERAGLHPKDRIIAIDQTPIDDWTGFVQIIRAHPDQVLHIMVVRNQTHQLLPVQVGRENTAGKNAGYLGVFSLPPEWPKALLNTEKYSVVSAWLPALKETWMLTAFNGVVLGKMILGKISVHSLGGPVTIFQAAGEATVAGFQVYLGFIGFISLTIGFINLLPIPGLDGGHLLFQVIEGIFRRPVPARIQMIGFSIGMIFLVFLMIQATINDIMRLFF